jgi:OmpA-OmpF porin, OOP family
VIRPAAARIRRRGFRRAPAGMRRPSRAFRRAVVLLGATAIALGAGAANSIAIAGPQQIAASIGALDLTGSVTPLSPGSSVLPLELRASVVPLEVVRRRARKTVVTISADVLFAFNRATLSPSAFRTIESVARRVPRRSGVTVKVAGYTDSIGTVAYNLSLSRRRADAVAHLLRQALQGSPAPEIAAAGYGESDPVAPNTIDGKDNPRGRALNRRVTITLPTH